MSADEDPTLGEVARGVGRLEQTLAEIRTEMRTALDARVSKEAHSAEMATIRAVHDAMSARLTNVEVRTQQVEDERDRTRLAVTVALLTALVAPIVVALLLKGV